MRRLPPRVVGVTLILASLGSTWCHRVVYEAERHGPPQLAEFGLGLATFLLASAGILLFIHGAALFRGNRTGFGELPLAVEAESRIERPFAASASNVATLLDTRHGVSLMQARYGIAASRRVESSAGRTAFSADSNRRRRAPFFEGR